MYVYFIVSIMFSLYKICQLSLMFHVPGISMVSWCTESSACVSHFIVSILTKQSRICEGCCSFCSARRMQWLTHESNFNFDSIGGCPLMLGRACRDSIQVMYKTEVSVTFHWLPYVRLITSQSHFYSQS